MRRSIFINDMQLSGANIGNFNFAVAFVSSIWIVLATYIYALVVAWKDMSLIDASLEKWNNYSLAVKTFCKGMPTMRYSLYRICLYTMTGPEKSWLLIVGLLLITLLLLVKVIFHFFVIVEDFYNLLLGIKRRTIYNRL